MKETSDEWLREGIEIGQRYGEMKARKETAIKMAGRGTAVDAIADLLDVSVSLVKELLEGRVPLVK